jgi:transcription antitermination factor NusA-like protein
VVPDELVSRLIGKSGENVRQIMSRTRTRITFFKKEDNPNVPAASRESGRVCTIEGNEREVSEAIE